MQTTLLVLFFASGASALVYEVVWTRMLTLHFGATSVGLAAVLSSFMAGMALGAAALGRWGARVERPLRAYGLAELGTAATATLVPGVIALFDGPLGRAYGPSGPGFAFHALRFGVAVLALAPPTFLMGATLPLLVQALGRDRARIGQLAGRAYATNTLGAMTGAFLTGFVLIHALGMHATLLVAVATNASIGLVALALSRPEGRQRTPDVADAPSGGASLCGIAAFCGFGGLSSLAYEVVWTRYFVNTFMSTVTAFSTILIATLGGLALGAYGASVLVRRARIAFVHLGLLEGAIALLALLSLWFFQSLPEWTLRLAVGASSLGFARVLVIVGAMFVPVCLMGMVLPLGVHLARGGGARVSSTVGTLGAASAVGSTLGPLVAVFVGLPVLGLGRSIAAMAALQALACFATGVWWVAGSKRLERAAALTFAAGLLAFAATQAARYGRAEGGGDMLPPRLVLAHAERVLYYRDTSEATIVVSANEATGARTLFVDGFPATSDDGTTAYMRMMSHLPAVALSRSPESVLVICVGTGITLGAASLYAPAILDAVEISPGVIQAAGFFAQQNHDVLRAPGLRLVIDDGRNYLTMTGRQYDVITLEPLAPYFAGTASLYTREFNALARAHLARGGVFAQWLPLQLVSDRDARGIVRAVAEEFAHVAVWKLAGDVSAIILASERPLALDVAVGPELARQDLARFLPAGTTPADHLVLGDRGVAAYVAGVAPLSDDRPTVEYRPFGADRLRLGSRELYERNTTNLRAAGGLGPEPVQAR